MPASSEKRKFLKAEGVAQQGKIAALSCSHRKGVMSEISLDSIDDSTLAFCWLSLHPRDRAKILENAPKTLWVLGAGASHHYGLNRFGVKVPLSNGFFAAFNDLPTSQGFEAHVGPLISFLEHYRGVSPLEVNKWNENIEDFMTSVEAELAQLRERLTAGRLQGEDIKKKFSLAMVFANMNFIFANVLNEATNGPSRSLYRELLQLCGPNDAFVTFNWDTLLDRALADTGGWSPNDGYGIKFASILDGTWKSEIDNGPTFQTGWRLLKLHGSTNWLVPYMAVNFDTLDYASLVPDSSAVFLFWQATMPYLTHHGRWRGGYFPTGYCYYPPNIPGNQFTKKQIAAPEGHVIASFTYKTFSPFSEPSDSGVPSSPLLITPVRQKKYDTYSATLGGLWDQTVKHLETVDRLVVVGYSFPVTDARPLDLFRAALKATSGKIELEIVAPGVKDIVARIGEDAISHAKNFRTHDMTFEDYINILASEMPQMMKTAAEENEEVRKWVKMMYVMREASLHRAQQEGG